MVIELMKCGMCGEKFEVELLDRNDPREKNIIGQSVRCPKCNSTFVEAVRRVRRAS